MPLPSVGGQQGFKPATSTATGGSYSRKFKEGRKAQQNSENEYEPDQEAMESLAELKRERNIE